MNVNMASSSEGEYQEVLKSSHQIRYYIQGSVVPFEEDSTNEFKGHRNLAVEEIPPMCVDSDTGKRSRAPISK